MNLDVQQCQAFCDSNSSCRSVTFCDAGCYLKQRCASLDQPLAPATFRMPLTLPTTPVQIAPSSAARQPPRRILLMRPRIWSSLPCRSRLQRLGGDPGRYYGSLQLCWRRYGELRVATAFKCMLAAVRREEKAAAIRGQLLSRAGGGGEVHSAGGLQPKLHGSAGLEKP
eukprot:s927_g1.t1